MPLPSSFATQGCGEKALRFRPMLVYAKKHADLTLEMLDKAAKAIKK
jgi:4-aminobutyrate aminotransferase-like enzyme